MRNDRLSNGSQVSLYFLVSLKLRGVFDYVVCGKTVIIFPSFTLVFFIFNFILMSLYNSVVPLKDKILPYHTYQKNKVHI